MRRLWLRWIALVVFVAVLGTVFVNLAEWQLNRLAERKANNATILRNENAPIADAGTVFGHGPVTKAEQWRRVSATGTFDAAHQYLVRYRSNGDNSGYEVVTPLQTTNGPVVLVDRGLVPVAGGKAIPTTLPTPPAGTVTVIGRVRVDEHGRRNAITPVNGQMRLINSAAIAATLPYPVAPGYLGAITVAPAQAGGFQPIDPPELSEGPHFWYAVQWFMFAGLAIVGVVVFVRSDLRERRAQRNEPAKGELAGSSHESRTA